MSAGKGVDTLMDGYIANNSCIEQWQNRMDALVEWKAKNILIYEGGRLNESNKTTNEAP